MFIHFLSFIEYVSEVDAFTCFLLAISLIIKQATNSCNYTTEKTVNILQCIFLHIGKLNL